MWANYFLTFGFGVLVGMVIVVAGLFFAINRVRVRTVLKDQNVKKD